MKTDLFVKPLLQGSAEIELALYDAPFPPFKITDVIAAGGIGRYRSGDLVSSGFDGALTVSSNQPLAIVAILSYDDGEGGSAAYEGIASGSSEVIIPQVKFLAGGVTTNVYVQNVATQQIAFDITFTSASGSNSCTDSVDLAPGSRFVFDAAVLQRCGLQPTFVGSAKVTSSGPVLAATALETGNFTASAYNGFAPNEAGTELVFPLVTRNSPIALTTRFGLYNTSSNDPANVDIGFVKSGLAASCTTQVNLAPGPNIELNISSFLASIPDCQGSGVWEGSAILNSNLPLVTSVHVSVQSDTAAYKGFTTANATDKIALPLIMRNNEGSTSAITIMNGPFDNTTITCTFTGSAETATIPFLQPNESVILDLGDSSAVNLPDGYLGAATCASQPSQPIVGVVSNDNTLGAAALYDAINY